MLERLKEALARYDADKSEANLIALGKVGYECRAELAEFGEEEPFATMLRMCDNISLARARLTEAQDRVIADQLAITTQYRPNDG